MTKANIQFFDPCNNAEGTAADWLRSAAKLLETAYAVGEVNIFGEIETAESIADSIAANRVNASGIISKVLAALRSQA